MVLDNRFPAKRTWASSFSKRVKADVDGYFPELCDVNCDIKIFQDTVSGYLSKLIAEFQKNILGRPS